MDELSRNHLKFSPEDSKMVSALESSALKMCSNITTDDDIDFKLEDHELRTLKCIDDFDKKCDSDCSISFSFSENKLVNKMSHVDYNNDVLSITNTDGVMEISSQDITIKTEQSFKATDDESMAVEALRQLGGMFDDVVTEEKDISISCHFCDVKFALPNDLHNHMRICKNVLSESFTCNNCKDIFTNRQEFENHGCEVQEVYSCRFCNSTFFKTTDLKTHIEEEHRKERPYKCRFCSQDFPRSSSLTNHLKIHNYQPGRALLSDHQVFISGIPNSFSTDSLANWNLGYETVDPLVQQESVDLHLSVTEDLIEDQGYVEDPSDPNPIESSELTSFDVSSASNIPIKEEVAPYPLGQSDVIVNTDEKRPHVCSHCGISFSREKALASHMKLHMIGWPGIYECENCAETFSSLSFKLQHKKTCLINSAMFSSENDPDFSQPALSAAQIDPVEFDYFEQEPIKKSNGNVKAHVKVGKHSCPYCDKRFTTKQKMYRHMWIHRKKTFSCEMCAKLFEAQGDLDKHRLSEHPADTPYLCQECGKCFASRQGLWEHGRIHGDNAASQFSCNLCSKTFSSRQGYLIHNRTHTGERPYGCRFCMKAFRDGGTLRKHERIHTGERPHVCPICLHDFNQKVVLREHVRWVHTAAKMMNESGFFTCQICSLNIADREELCAHLVKHSDQMAAEAKDSSVPVKLANGNVRKANAPRAANKPNSRKKLNGVNKKDNVTSLSSTQISKVNENDMDDVSFVAILNENRPLAGVEGTSDENNFLCDMCGDKFLSQRELSRHVGVHI